jgi:hypothetical protein
MAPPFFASARFLAVAFLPLLPAACGSSVDEGGQGSGGASSGAATAGAGSQGIAAGSGASGAPVGAASGSSGTGGTPVGTGDAGSAMGGSAGTAAGSGGVGAGVGGTAGSSGTAGAGGAEACQHGEVAGDEVLIVGDSYFALSGEITKELRRLSGANYRDVSVSGTKMGAIAKSYTDNRTPQPKVVIMDGGGNDILQNPGCAPGCAQELQAVTEAKNFLKQMATDGVSDVVFLFYYDMPSMKAGLDWMRPKMATECEQSPVPCHFVDNQPLFAGMDANTYTIDGIHPNTAAAHIIAKQVWERMQQECVAQ